MSQASNQQQLCPYCPYGTSDLCPLLAGMPVFLLWGSSEPLACAIHKHSCLLHPLRILRQTQSGWITAACLPRTNISPVLWDQWFVHIDAPGRTLLGTQRWLDTIKDGQLDSADCFEWDGRLRSPLNCISLLFEALTSIGFPSFCIELVST